MEKLANISQFEALINNSNESNKLDYPLWPTVAGIGGEWLVRHMLDSGYTPLQTLGGFAGATLASYGGAKLLQKLWEKLTKQQNKKITNNRTRIDNGAKWNAIKKSFIPLLAGSLMSTIPPNYINPQPAFAPETPVQTQFTSPEVQQAATDLIAGKRPLSKREMRDFLSSRFGYGYRKILSPEDIQYILDANEEALRHGKWRDRMDLERARRLAEEQELSEIYSGKRPYPEIVDENFQRKVLEYGKPIK